MKAICISCFDYYDTRTRGIIEYLTDKGFEVKYLITDFNHFSQERYKATYGNAEQIHVPEYHKNISPQRLLSHIIFSNKVIKEVRRYNPELIYCIVPPNTLVRKISKYKIISPHCKVVYDIYDMWPESFPYKSRNPLIGFLFKKWADLRDDYIKYADQVICVSQKQKEELDKKYKISAKVLLPNIAVSDLPNYSFNIKNRISFLYLGHVNHIADIDLGTKLLGKLAQKREVVLHIIGEGQNRAKWISMLNEVGVKTICHGVVFDQKEKMNIFEQCNIGLNIPKKEINSTLALKSVEYMHFGLPFINTGLGDNKEIVANQRIGININNSEDFENAISSILALEQEDLKSMHLNSIQYYEKRFASQNYDELFNNIINYN